MKTIIRQRLKKAKRRIESRLRPIAWEEQAKPMLAAKNIQYEISERGRAVAAGGIGAMHLVAQCSGLIELIDQNVRVLKRHIPYHESDHVLNIAYNVLCGGSRLEHIEYRRNDEAYLDALGAQRIPDPTTEGDFCRRFETSEQVDILMEAINEARLNVWREQPEDEKTGQVRYWQAGQVLVVSGHASHCPNRARWNGFPCLEPWNRADAAFREGRRLRGFRSGAG